jgi:hypothetical protein
MGNNHASWEELFSRRHLDLQSILKIVEPSSVFDTMATVSAERLQ